MHLFRVKAIIKTFESQDKKLRAEVCERHDGLFWFRIEYECVGDEYDRLNGFETYWLPGFESGLYDSAEHAERDLRALPPWNSEE